MCDRIREVSGYLWAPPPSKRLGRAIPVWRVRFPSTSATSRPSGRRGTVASWDAPSTPSRTRCASSSSRSTSSSSPRLRPRRSRQPLTEGVRLVPTARCEPGRVPRPHRERRRDHRPRAPERPCDVHGSARSRGSRTSSGSTGPAAWSSRPTATSPTSASGSSGPMPRRTGRFARSSWSTSTARRPRVDSRSRSWTTSRIVHGCSTGSREVRRPARRLLAGEEHRVDRRHPRRRPSGLTTPVVRWAHGSEVDHRRRRARRRRHPRHHRLRLQQRHVADPGVHRRGLRGHRSRRPSQARAEQAPDARSGSGGAPRHPRSLGSAIGRGSTGWALFAQLATVVVAGVFLFFAIQSFRAARLAREAEPTPT